MYLFDNELFAVECMAKYAMEGLIVKYRGVHDGHADEFAHCPEPACKGEWGYYLTYSDHQHQGLLQSKDMGYRCFWTAKVSNWLKPKQPNFFELYGIFKYYISGEHNSMHGKVGELHPAYKSIKIREKPVMIIKPDGTKLHFGSIKEAAKEAELLQCNVSNYLRYDGPVKRGKCKDWQFLFT